MLKALSFALIIVALSMVFFAIKIIFKKNGRFPDIHVGYSAALRGRGITCAQAMDALERAGNPHKVNERSTGNHKQ